MTGWVPGDRKVRGMGFSWQIKRGQWVSAANTWILLTCGTPKLGTHCSDSPIPLCRWGN